MSSNKGLSAALIGILCVGVGAISSTASAQTSASTQGEAKSTGGLQEVIVTAQKRSENIQNVPISIVALSQDQIVNAGVTNLLQLSTLVSGVTMRTASGGVAPFIRGVGTPSDGVENPVAAYVDGVYIPNQREIAMELIDVNQLTVLKGPQGTLFGRNATGGVIQITTDGPTPTGKFRAETGSDNYQTWRTAAFASGPLTHDVSGSLMASYVTQGKGWGYDPVDGQQLRKIKYRDNFRAKLNINLTDNVQLRLSADYQQRNDSDGIAFVPWKGTTLTYEPGVVNTNPFDSRGGYPELLTLNSGGASATLDADLGFARLVSITAMRRGQFYFQLTVDSTPLAVLNPHYNDFYHSVSQELQLVSHDGGRAQWVLGAFYFYNYEEYEPAVVDLRGPFAPDPTSTRSIVIYGQKNVPSIAGFGQTTIEVLPQTNLTAGLRLTNESTRFRGSQDAVLNNGTFVPNVIVPVAQSLTSNQLTWRFALDHKFTDSINGYVSYNRGFKSGGFNLDSPTNPGYLPERLDDYEIGLKTELLDHKLRINSGLFYYQYKNLQVSDYSTGFQTIKNAASSRIYGLDTDMEVRFTDRFYATGNLSLLDAKYVSFPNAGFTVPHGNPDGSPGLTIGNAAGNYLPSASPVQVNVSLNYNLPTGIGPLLFNLTNSFNSRFYWEPDNYIYQPSFDYLNTSVSWTSSNSKFGVRLWATNLLNKAVQSVGTAQSFGYLVDYGNPPRLYGITFDLRL